MSTFLKTILATAAATGAVAFIWKAATTDAPPERDEPHRSHPDAQADQLSDQEREVLLNELKSQL